MVINIIDKILSRNSFFYYTLFYLTCKLFPYTKDISFLTYIMFVYAVLVFIYNRVIKYVDLSFPYCWFSYGIIIISIISILINGYTDLRKVIIDLIPIFVNLFLFFPTLKNDNYDSLFSIFNKIMIYIYVLGIVVTLANITNYLIKFYNGSIQNVVYFRMFGVFGNPNLVGWFESVFLGSIIYMILHYNDNIYLRTLNYISLSLCIFAIIASQCRSVYLASIIFIIYYFLTNKKFNDFFNNHTKLSILTISILVIIIFSSLVLLNGRFGSDREDIIRYTFYNLKNNNIFFGLSYGRIRQIWCDNYYSFFNKNKNLPIRDIFAEANTHNILLQQLSTNGIIGFSILTTFIISLLRELFHFINKFYSIDDATRKFFLCLSYFIIVGLVVGMFDNSILQSMIIFMNFTFLVSSGMLLKLNIKRNI